MKRKMREIPTATSSEASRQDTETDSKEAAKQRNIPIFSWEWFEGEDYLVGWGTVYHGKRGR